MTLSVEKAMEKFCGTVEELKALVDQAGSRGVWTETEHGYQFRSQNSNTQLVPFN